ncbi:DUF998 domain-containing protein [Dactylosporangium siamense]|uniref:DUF998 domain-containing protein n=1 Tax=Dactylosporangium siamense TaxID=685454 RepID=A0A919PYV3_9ACTN|nr:DUF998 domain-containing protein [Dactylosporangium siamense]GIG52927.1 hypothetical protein Dsi01nite_109680 [Dactylosporangium siamense]
MRPSRFLLAAGLAGPILFLVIATLAGWLRPGYSARTDAISDLGVGENAWLQNANFLLFGILLVGYAVGFRRAMAPLVGVRTASWGAVVIGAGAVGTVGAVVFPAAPATGLFHFLFGFLIVMVSAVVAACYGGRVFRRVPGWRGLARYSTWTAVVSVALFITTFFVLNPASPMAAAGIGGLVNRTLATVAFAWYAVTAWKLLRMYRRTGPPTVLSDTTMHPFTIGRWASALASGRPTGSGRSTP